MSDGFSFDLLSYGRAGPAQRDRLSPAQIALVARTAGRAPEVMIKVLPAGKATVRAAAAHLDYIDREGKLALETDEGQVLCSRDAAAEVLRDWDLELDELRPSSALSPGGRRTAPRLVYKLVFSMPPGTPPDKLFAAVKKFCREEFALKHRYALAMHTDDRHPHVHAVVKAVSEQGQRLNVKQAPLRQWRAEFARHLRELGVRANATSRYARGQMASRKSDGIYRAGARGDSRYWRQQAESVARQLMMGRWRIEAVRPRLLESRQRLESHWQEIARLLDSQGQRELARATREFVHSFPKPRTEREHIRDYMLQQHARAARERGIELTR